MFLNCERKQKCGSHCVEKWDPALPTCQSRSGYFQGQCKGQGGTLLLPSPLKRWQRQESKGWSEVPAVINSHSCCLPSPPFLFFKSQCSSIPCSLGKAAPLYYTTAHGQSESLSPSLFWRDGALLGLYSRGDVERDGSPSLRQQFGVEVKVPGCRRHWENTCLSFWAIEPQWYFLSV